MHELIATIIACVLTIAGTLLLAYSGIKGKQLEPDSAENIRYLVETLTPVLESQRNLFEVIDKELRGSKELASKTPPSIYVNNEMAAKKAIEACNKIGDALNISKAAQTAAKVRIYISLGSIVLMVAAMISLYVAAGTLIEKCKTGAESIVCVVVQKVSR